MKKIFLLFAVIIISNYTSAQFGSTGSTDARSMGMARTYNSISTGIYSNGINPANLMLSRDGHFDFVTLLPFPALSLRTGTDFISFNEFNYYFGGVDGRSRYLSEDDKKKLNSLFEGGGEIFFDASTTLFGAVYKHSPEIGAFGFAVTDYVGGNFSVPEAIVDLSVRGNLKDKVFSFEDASINSWWIRNYSLSYAREIPDQWNFFDRIAVGITLKMVHGFYYAGTDHVDTYFSTGDMYRITGKADMIGYSSFSSSFAMDYSFDSTDNDMESNFDPFPDPAGTGFGADIGFNVAYEKIWNFSFAITDIGQIFWKNKTAKFTSLGDIYLDDITNKEQLDSAAETLKADGEYVSEFSTGLPAALRFGSSAYFDNKYDAIPGSLLVAFDYNQGLNDLPGNSTHPRFSIGAEWKPGDWIPFIRTGLSFGGTDDFNWAFGLGIDAGILEFHLATSDIHSFLAPNSATRVSLSIGSRWKFD